MTNSTFSGAMQHAYDYAKKKLGITVDPKEIEKVAKGKENHLMVKQISTALVKFLIYTKYNKGGSKPFELNMYKEEMK